MVVGATVVVVVVGAVDVVVSAGSSFTTASDSASLVGGNVSLETSLLQAAVIIANTVSRASRFASA